MARYFGLSIWVHNQKITIKSINYSIHSNGNKHPDVDHFKYLDGEISTYINLYPSVVSKLDNNLCILFIGLVEIKIPNGKINANDQ